MTHLDLTTLSPVRLALLAQRMRAELDGAAWLTAEPIAVTGLACRFPGGPTPEAFWRLLLAGGDAITEIPPDRWDAERYFDPDPAAPGRMNSRWGGFVDGVQDFDAEFFGLAPREVERLDPRQRLVLEVGWEALEDAGLTREQLVGSATGVFVGVSSGDFGQQQLRDPHGLDAYSATGAANSIVANRLSFWLDLRGPSLAVDTACSSSLVTIHLACDALRSRACDRAVAGGVNAILQPELSISLAKWGALAPDGRCKAFDARADGFVRGEGCGLVVLRRLADALRDGDPVLAVVRGSAINQDGRSAGLTAPNLVSQRDVIGAALRRAGVRPEQVGLLEAHGTGTSLGDPIEVGALAEVLGAPAPEAPALLLGSVKANIGHLEAAAGIAGLIKVVLALRHAQIPPLVHFRRLNPNIDLDGTRIEIPRQPRPWPRGEGRRIAGISAFGMGGTNAHVLVEEAPAASAAPAEATAATGATQDARPRLLLLSAASEGALEALAGAHREQLHDPNDPFPLDDRCFTAARRRTHFEHRLAVVGDDPAALVAGLDDLRAGRPCPLATRGRADPEHRPRVVVVFSPHGSQWAGMGTELWTHAPVFRARLQEVDAVLDPLLGWSVAQRLAAGEDGPWLDRTAEVQPALFAFQLALAAQLLHWGLRPDAVVGHSMGEVAAACVAGVIGLEDAARVAVIRSRLLGTLEGEGAMAVVELPLAEAEALAAERGLHVAVSNSPRFTVLAGDIAVLEPVIEELEARGLHAGLGLANVASHTAGVASLVDALRGGLAGIEARPEAASLPIVSPTSPQPRFDVEHWAAHLTQPVRFWDALQRLVAGGAELFVELAPHPVLRTAIQEGLSALDAPGEPLAVMHRQAPERAGLLALLGELHVRGASVDLEALFGGTGRCVSLPAYPWQRRRLWHDPPPPAPAFVPAGGRAAAAGEHPLLGAPLAVAGARVWQSLVGPEMPAFVVDHRVHGVVIMPGAAFVELVLTAGDAVYGAGRAVVESLALQQACVLDRPRVLQTTVERIDADHVRLRVHSRPAEPTDLAASDDAWTLHVEARCRRDEAAAAPLARPPAEPLPRSISDHAHYARMERCGVEFGPRFRGLAQLRGGEGRARARLVPVESVRQPRAPYIVHPALLDLALQVVEAAVDPDRAGLYLPVRMGEVRRYGDPAAAEEAVVTLTGEDPHALVADVELRDGQGAAILSITGFTARRVDEHTRADRWDDALYQLCWRALPSLEPAAGEPPRWLLVGEGAGLAAHLVAELDARGWAGQVRRVDVDADVEVLRAEAWSAVVYLGALTADPHGSADADADADTHALAALLRWVQALVEQDTQTRLWLVTHRAQAVDGGRVDPRGALVWGLARSLALEHRILRTARVDLDGVDPTAARLLLDELRADGDDDQLAHRSGHRHALRLAPLPRGRLSGMAPPVRPEGAYLIAGGLGGIGLTLARWLVERGAGELVLLGRSGRPADPAALEALRATGARVIVVAGDAADPRVVAAACARATLALRGVIHCAVVLDDGVITALGPERFEPVVRAKLGVARALDRATDDLDLDFFVLFSSAASLLGAPGQASYAAANAALDALAADRRARGRPGLSINWGPWAEVGLAAGDEARFEARGMAAMPPAVGVELLGRLLDLPQAQVGVVRLDLSRWQAVDPRALAAPLFAELVEDLGLHAPTSERAALLARPAPERGPALERLVLDQIALVLRLGRDHEPDLHRPFGAMGFDSLTALELRNRLEARLELSLPATLIWTYPTPAALTEALARALWPSEDPADASPDEPGPPPLAEPLDAQEVDELETLLTGLGSLSDGDLDDLLQ